MISFFIPTDPSQQGFSVFIYCPERRTATPNKKSLLADISSLLLNAVDRMIVQQFYKKSVIIVSATTRHIRTVLSYTVRYIWQRLSGSHFSRAK